MRPLHSVAVRVLGPRFFHVRAKSLRRANLAVFLSLMAAFIISGFPHLRFSWWLVVPALTTMAGTVDTLRCMQKKWNFYHGGVVLCVYMDLMVLTTILFFLFYPWLPRLVM